ncbi:MAG TPA: hypothetical protein VMN82_14770 [Thermoanaerobaculia bacterium]|nr:hypothetical protein [Thermoanaerobaculia bacterium]
MKRLVLVFACVALASPMLAEKPQVFAPLAPTAMVTINGSPLTINIGDDTRMQVYNSNVPGTGQFYPPGSSLGNSGVWVNANGTLFGPFLGTTYTPVSLSPVTGTGTAGDPFTVVIVENAGAVLQMTETITYVNGAAAANISVVLAAIPPPSGPEGGGIPVEVFIGADLYLAGNDAGFPVAVPGASAGSHGADETCSQQLQYTISFLGTTPATNYTANGYSQVFSEIASGTLSNTVAPGCLDDGAALQWNQNLAGQPLTINTGVSFTGQAVPVGAAVPALSVAGIAALVVLLAVVGYVLARKTSLGA